MSTESLNDIMFFLLLFFLIISTLANPNVIKLLLPKSAKSTLIPPRFPTKSPVKTADRGRRGSIGIGGGRRIDESMRFCGQIGQRNARLVGCGGQP